MGKYILTLGLWVMLLIPALLATPFIWAMYQLGIEDNGGQGLSDFFRIPIDCYPHCTNEAG